MRQSDPLWTLSSSDPLSFFLEWLLQTHSPSTDKGSFSMIKWKIQFDAKHSSGGKGVDKLFACAFACVYVCLFLNQLIFHSGSNQIDSFAPPHPNTDWLMISEYWLSSNDKRLPTNGWHIDFLVCNERSFLHIKFERRLRGWNCQVGLLT